MQSDRGPIVFAINSLTAGGAERALSDLLVYLEDRLRGYSVHLILLDVEEERHKVPAWVRKDTLGADFNLLKSIALLAKHLHELKPTVVISFLNRANCANVISSKILGYPCIISERVHTTSHFGRGIKAAINRAIVRLIYPLANQVIAVSEGVRNDLTRNFGVRESNIRVIHNPINPELLRQRSLEPPCVPLPDPYILAIGRMVPNKNFRLLIEAYQASGVSENLVILGEGPGREELEKLLADLGLQRRVLLPGYARNPYPIIRAARLFISSSSAEGFPNALIEAMALGCPVVATDCETGPMEVLTGQTGSRCREVTLAKYGILVPVNSVDLLGEAIRIAFRDDIRTRYSRLGPERARNFEVQESVNRYWSTIAPYITRP